jgi:hypothetical protein
MAAVTELLSESIWPTALGLLVGLISLWFYKYLSGDWRPSIGKWTTRLLNWLTNFRDAARGSRPCPRPITARQSLCSARGLWLNCIKIRSLSADLVL